MTFIGLLMNRARPLFTTELLANPTCTAMFIWRVRIFFRHISRWFALKWRCRRNWGRRSLDEVYVDRHGTFRLGCFPEWHWRYDDPPESRDELVPIWSDGRWEMGRYM